MNNSSSSFDFCILGAGLAGISLADTLNKKGASVGVIDTGEIAAGASGTPLGLVNPATGRYGTKSWLAEECYHSIFRSLEEVQTHVSGQFFRKSGVLRPALDKKIATKMKENFDSTSWPDGWCQWLDVTDFKGVNPDVSCVDGGLWLPVGLTVDISTYLKSFAGLLKQRAVKFITQANYSIYDDKRGFNIKFKDAAQIHAENIIHTSGFDTKNSTYWNFLPLIPVKGQMAIFKSPSPLQFEYAISALGYIASLSKDEFVIGSTYEHNFEHRNPDEAGLKYLTERMKKVYPKLINSSKLAGQWAGVRASTPNRQPILGRHPENENMYVFAGLGSKGLLYSVYLAESMANYIIHSNDLPEDISLSRFRT